MVDPKKSAESPPTVICKSDGVYIYDLDGNKLLDCSASLWNVNVGHNRPEIKQAITDQLRPTGLLQHLRQCVQSAIHCLVGSC